MTVSRVATPLYEAGFCAHVCGMYMGLGSSCLSLPGQMLPTAAKVKWSGDLPLDQVPQAVINPSDESSLFPLVVDLPSQSGLPFQDDRTRLLPPVHRGFRRNRRFLVSENCWNRVFSISMAVMSIKSRRERHKGSFSSCFLTTLLNRRSMLAVALSQ
jgi:hypothetical protein